jgi:molybdopterin converting factor subunit 1
VIIDMMISILFFAGLRDRAKTHRAELDLPVESTVGDLKAAIEKQFPAVVPLLANALISVNQAYALDTDVIPSGAEVALFPPVSGGSSFPTILKVTYDPLDLDELVEQITLETTGAVCVFSGMVRGVTTRGEAHETAALEYEAYIPMAETKMAQVAEEIRLRWPTVEGIVIVQRIGRLNPKTPTVLIACGASHRDTGVFEAARYGIDRLKEIVPIWKKEIGAHGEVWVEGDYHPHQGD